MTHSLTEIRALLMHFENGNWRDLYVRTDTWTVFMAKEDGAANPLLTSVASDVPGATIDAPHLGLFTASVAIGGTVIAGASIGQLEVLGDIEEVISDKAGRVSSIMTTGGALVEYGAPLIRLAA
jgi:acetyl-CoA carboxylase biotin carboxyl carrier protein